MISILFSLSLAAATAQPGQAGPAGSEWLVATIGHSEWCPAGNVRLDLDTGRYALVATAARRECSNPRGGRRLEQGRLDGRRLTPIRAAYLRAMSDGLRRQGCYTSRDGEIIVSNSGTPVLVATNGSRTFSAPD